MCVLCSQLGFVAHAGSVAGPGTVASGTGKPTLSTTQIIEQLRDGDADNTYWKWTSGSVTYSMPSTSPAGVESAGFRTMTAGMVQKATLAFEAWDDLIALNLNPSSNNVNADITFAYSTRTQGGGTYTAWEGSYHTSSTYAIEDAEIWLNATWTTHDQDSDLTFGSYGLLTYLHEIGHALGLSHPGTYAQSTISYVASAEFNQDTHQYTLMSYFEADENGSGTDHYGQSGQWKYASTPMLYDVLAIQAAYGADMTTRTGHTVYGFNSNAGRDYFDFTKNPDPIFTIWDAGGTDTLDASGYSTNQTIDLDDGSYSSIGYLTGNVAIAFNAIIENANGGSGADTIHGNAVANVIYGNGGNDTIHGYEGDDVLVGGGGRNTIDGGAGNDFIYADSGDAVGDLRGGTGYDTLAIVGANWIPGSFSLSTYGFEAARTYKYDTTNTTAFRVVDTGYDGQWRQLDQNYQLDDGSAWYYVWDAYTATDWSYYGVVYDTAAALDYYYLAYDTGASVFVDADNRGNEWWSSGYSYYDTLGRLDYQSYTGDHGVVWTADYDAGDQYAWHYVATTLDANGAVLSQQYYQADGSVYVL